jgi:hypothetical protein
MAGDAELISRVLVSDDHEAFADLVWRHQSAVRQFLRRLTGNDWGRADDLAQETFWKAYRHLTTFQGRGRFLSLAVWYRPISSSSRMSGARVAQRSYHSKMISPPTAMEASSSRTVARSIS